MREGGIQFDVLSRETIGCAIEVHRVLGPGLLESAYQACLANELARRSIGCEKEVALPVRYKDVLLDCGYRLDLVVDGKIVVECKAVEELAAIHRAQILTYMRLSGLGIGLLINFNVPLLKHGIERFVL